MFSRRSEFRSARSRIGRLVAEHREAGRALVDLTESNPTSVGLETSRRLLERLADPRGAHYQAEPFGLAEARAAVADYYAERDIEVPPERIVLCASTSEAYGWLLKLFCDPGDTVLVPAPSYPLYPMLAQLESVELVPYRLVYLDGWRLERTDLERTVSAGGVRAILIVHPNNPTGALLHADDAAWLLALCARHKIVAIVDEVFLDYPHRTPLHLARTVRKGSFAATEEAPCVVLSGLSKVALTPQLKLSWMVCAGPSDWAREALRRLELIADCYLSVSAGVQLALDAIIDASLRSQAEVRARIDVNLSALDSALAAAGEGCPVRRLPSDAGWYSLLQVPRTCDDDTWVERLVQHAGVLVYPGYVFDIAEPGTLVLSLLVAPREFADAAKRVVDCLAS